jgi:hypothetical protein
VNSLLLIAVAAIIQAWGPGPAGAMTVIKADGGSKYYSRFSPALPAKRSYFPIGVWFGSVISQADVNLDKGAGLNLYVVLTANSNLSVVQSSGIPALLQQDEWGNSAEARANPVNAGWVLGDEIDMQFGPEAGYAELGGIRASLPDDGRLHFANYGKGVSFWLSDQEAARYVNAFQDVVSADNYWFTDQNICSGGEGGALLAGGADLSPAKCHRASNYGATVRRVRGLMNPPGSKPVWAFVELGHPFTESDWPTITPPQVRAAVWQSLIAGARGIIYFNHSFGGPDQTQNILRDGADPHSPYAPIRSVVRTLNRKIAALAPVLNSPTVRSGWSQGRGTTAMVKWYSPRGSKSKKCKSKMRKKAGKCKKGRLYVFAGSAGSSAKGRFSLPCVGRATAAVVGENRTVRVRRGSFTDHFANGNAIHIYRIDGVSKCRPPKAG